MHLSLEIVIATALTLDSLLDLAQFTRDSVDIYIFKM